MTELKTNMTVLDVFEANQLLDAIEAARAAQ